MTDAPLTRTGRRVPELVADAEADIADVCRHLSKASDLLEALEREGRGVNGMSGTARGCRSQITQVIAALEKEATELRKKMTGPALVDEITTRVDEEHASRVKAARKETA